MSLRGSGKRPRRTDYQPTAAAAAARSELGNVYGRCGRHVKSGLRTPIMVELFLDGPAPSAPGRHVDLAVRRGTRGYLKPASVRRKVLRRADIARDGQYHVLIAGLTHGRALGCIRSSSRHRRSTAGCPVLNVGTLRYARGPLSRPGQGE